MFLSFWQSSILRKKPLFMHLSSYCISFRDAALISTSDTTSDTFHRHSDSIASVYRISFESSQTLSSWNRCTWSRIPFGAACTPS